MPPLQARVQCLGQAWCRDAHRGAEVGRPQAPACGSWRRDSKPPMPPSTWLPLWDPRVQIGFLSHPTLPPGGSERVVVRVAPGRVCVGAVSRPQACFGAAAAGGLSREEEVSVSFWAWRGAALAPLTEALRLNYEAGWGPGPLSQTPPGTEAGGQPLSQVLPGHMSRGSADRCPRDLGRLTGPPGACGQGPGVPAGLLWEGAGGAAILHSAEG